MENHIYGIYGRWSDHICSSKTSYTPLATAIQDYGQELLRIEEIEHAELDRLDELETKWISELNTIVPNGLNVAKHSRNRHHQTSTLVNCFSGNVLSACIRHIKRNGKYKLIYLILTLHDNSIERICFGQNRACSFEKALEDARQFVNKLGCPFNEENNTSDDLTLKYTKKIDLLKGRIIEKIRITTASSLIAVYISIKGIQSYKDQIRICFGGKHVPFDTAKQTALSFINSLTLDKNCEIIDTATSHNLKGPQQATVHEDVAIPREENSVIASNGSYGTRIIDTIV